MKLLLSLFLSFFILNAAEMGLKGGGCTLAQEGKVQVNYDSKVYTDVKYTANAKSGKNFREIFVGTVIDTNNISMKITDYKPNKRVKGKPKTGIFILSVTIGALKKDMIMTYIFDKGMMSTAGIIDKKPLGFTTNVKYSLCNVSIK